MIIVALVATLASSMVWQQWRAIQVEAAERARTQSAWVLSGALDWTRMILREDAKTGGTDHLGEPWAVPLAEARLSTFLAADKDNTEDAPDAFLSGTITDANSRYNLANVVKGGKIDPLELKALQRLCENVGLSVDVATRISTGLRDASPPPAPEPAASGASVPAAAPPPAPNPNPPLMPRSAAQLAWLGIEPGAVQALQPYVVILPEATFINVNTAPREVLVAAVEGLDLATAERIVQSRQRVPIKSRGDMQALAPALPGRRASTGSPPGRASSRSAVACASATSSSSSARWSSGEGFRSRCCSGSGSPRATAWARESVQKCAAILRRRYNSAT